MIAAPVNQLAESNKLGENERFLLNIIQKNVTVLLRLINQILDFRKFENGKLSMTLSRFDISENIKDWTSVDEIDTYYTRMLNKEVYNKTGLIYGIGHAVYTISDPRALLLKELARDLAREKGRESEFAFLELLEERAIATFGRVKNNGKTVSSNIDFYSGFVYEMIGLPQEIFTPLFAMARIVGWCAHRNEELTFDGKRIIRPAYKNVLDDLAYIPIKKR